MLQIHYESNLAQCLLEFKCITKLVFLQLRIRLIIPTDYLKIECECFSPCDVEPLKIEKCSPFQHHYHIISSAREKKFLFSGNCPAHCYDNLIEISFGVSKYYPNQRHYWLCTSSPSQHHTWTKALSIRADDNCVTDFRGSS